MSSPVETWGPVSGPDLTRLLVELGFCGDVASAVPVAVGNVREALVLALELHSGPLRPVANVEAPASSSVEGGGGESGVAVQVGAGHATALTTGDSGRTSWNTFQRRLAGSGLSRSATAALYRDEMRARELGDTAAEGSPVNGGRRPSAAKAASSAGAPLEAGYVLMRAPESLQHLRGHHRCNWSGLLRRLGISHEAWERTRSQYFLPHYRDQATAEAMWQRQGLLLPLPVDPR